MHFQPFCKESKYLLCVKRSRGKTGTSKKNYSQKKNFFVIKSSSVCVQIWRKHQEMFVTANVATNIAIFQNISLTLCQTKSTHKLSLRYKIILLRSVLLNGLLDVYRYVNVYQKKRPILGLKKKTSKTFKCILFKMILCFLELKPCAGCVVCVCWVWHKALKHWKMFLTAKVVINSEKIGRGSTNIYHSF